MILESFRNVVVFSDVFKNFLKRFQAKFYRIFFIAKGFFSGEVNSILKIKEMIFSAWTKDPIWLFLHEKGLLDIIG